MDKYASNGTEAARLRRTGALRDRDMQNRDAALVAVLRGAVEALDVDTALVYLFEEGGEALRLAAAGGSPPSLFIMPEHMAVTDPYPTATACRSGSMAVASPSVQASEKAQLPGTVPFPSSIASVPLVYKGRRLGALSVVWAPAPTVEPTDPHRRLLWAMADDLSGTLGEMADDGVPMTPASKPVVVPVFRPVRAAVGDADSTEGSSDWGLPEILGSTAVTFMYHIHKLAAALNEAAAITDVMEVVKDRIMKPFGARSFVVTSVMYGSVWVAGYSDCPQEIVKRLHGSSVHRRSPFTDVLHLNSPLFYRDRTALLASYPEPDVLHMEDGGDGGSAYLPIGVGSRPTGACALGFGRPVRLSSEEQAVLMMMANLLGPTLLRARLSQAEQSLAERVQMKLLPLATSDLPGLATAARYVPASASGMGGDWYDVITVGRTRVGLVIGDVEGHSIDSSVIMAQLRTAVRSYLMEGHTPARVLQRTNLLLAQLDTALLATCCIVGFDTEDGTLEIASAGHPPPSIRYPDGSVVTPDLPTGFPLGVDLDARYTQTETSIPPNTVLMLYTDGLTNSATTELTAKSLLTSLGRAAETRPERLIDLILDARPEELVRRDDIALLIAEYEGKGAGGRLHIGRMSIQRHDLHGVKMARTFVRKHLHQWGLDAQVDDLELMTSELVTNALLHADSDVDLRMREYEDHLRVEVRDSDPMPAVPEPIALSNEPGSESEHGRGLVIVDALASEWGNSPSGRGKTIWVEQAIDS